MRREHYSLTRRTAVKTLGAFGLAGALMGTARAAPTIQDMVDDAAPGDTVTVPAGNYPEVVTIDKSLTLLGPNADISPKDGSRGPEAVVEGFRLDADDIEINGFRVVNGTKGVATVGGGVVRSDITVVYNDFETLSEWPVLHGFGFGGGVGSANWTISENRITDITGDDITAIVLFNVDGVTLDGNHIEHANAAASGRRGHNLDGCRDVELTNCYVDMGLRAPENTGANFAAARYSLQLSMSDRSVSNVHVCNNTFMGGYDCVVTLGNGNISDVDIENNTLTDNVIGLRFQAGLNGPAGSVSDVSVWRNDLADMVFGAFVDGTDTYTDLSLNLNDLSGNDSAGLFVRPGVDVTDVVDAERNWWGDRNGPGGALNDGDGVTSTKPWLRNANAAGTVPGRPCRGN